MIKIKEKKHHWAKKREKKKAVLEIRNIIRPILVRNFLIVLFSAVVVYSFVFSDFLEVANVSINTDGNIPLKDLQTSIEQEINGRYFKLISKKNFVFLNTGKLETKLRNDFRKIKKISIEKKFPDKLIIEIQERNLILSLCSRGECYFVDERGYAYEKMNLSSVVNREETIELIDESGKEVRENEYVLLPTYIEFIISIADDLRNGTDIEILKEYRTRSRISEELIVQTQKGWDIYLSAKVPIEKSIQTLKTLFNRHLMLRDLNELEYIDLRSENKVFYRMKGGVIEEEEELKKEEGLKKEEKLKNESEENKDSDKEKVENDN